MADKIGLVHTDVKRAEERLLGTKFCFNCQAQRPMEGGRSLPRGKTKIWKCKICVAKAHPAKKEKSNAPKTKLNSRKTA